MSVEVKTPTRTQFEHAEFQCGEKNLNKTSEISPAAVQQSAVDREYSRDDSFKFSNPAPQRRRRYSMASRLSEGQGGARRKRLKSSPTDKFVLPTRFLLGGNINDPLNLNELCTGELGKALNERTPQSSPIPLPSHRQRVDVQFPMNISDPLNLNCSDDSDLIGAKTWKKRKRHSHGHNKGKKRDDGIFISPQKEVVSEKNKDLMEALKIDIEPEPNRGFEVPETKKETNILKGSIKVSDKIVSPVLPQISPKTRKRRRMGSGGKPEASAAVSRSLLISLDSSPHDSSDSKKHTPPKKFRRQFSHAPKSSLSSPHKPKKPPKFVYGNYNRYYGYRNPVTESDHRLDCFKIDWFDGKDVLDIGCNVGHLTLAIGKEFSPKKVVGLDIDPSLISAARKNIRHYLSSSKVNTNRFPVSNAMNYGPIAAPPVSGRDRPVFPSNVVFMQGNYVPETDELLDLQKEEYDVILALSLTKWIHYNFGDSGLKRMFKRVFKQLRPGGRFILEPQPWSSYKKKKKLTDEIFKNFQAIKLRPERFRDYLLSKEVGFSTCEVVDVPYNASKGFRRTIFQFTKAETVQNSPKPDHASPDTEEGHSGQVTEDSTVDPTPSSQEQRKKHGSQNPPMASQVREPAFTTDKLKADGPNTKVCCQEEVDTSPDADITGGKERAADSCSVAELDCQDKSVDSPLTTHGSVLMDVNIEDNSEQSDGQGSGDTREDGLIENGSTGFGSPDIAKDNEDAV